MVVPDGERMARLEQVTLDVRDDIEKLHDEERRTRGRLHDLEKITTGLVELQHAMHRENNLRLQRLSLSIQWAGLVLSAAVIVLALLTYLAHS